MCDERGCRGLSLHLEITNMYQAVQLLIAQDLCVSWLVGVTLSLSFTVVKYHSSYCIWCRVSLHADSKVLLVLALPCELL